MATFYFNHDTGESLETQWTRHIQNHAYIEDVSKSISNATEKQTEDISVIVSHQTKEINDTIQIASIEQENAIRQSINEVCGTLDAGFNLLSNNLQKISYRIGEIRSELNFMSSMLDWKLSLLIEKQKITNLLLGNVAILLRIPDIQKERQYHIELGLKFLKNAIFDSDFYEDSLSNLIKAEQIEPTDFFTLHRIGLIYMYSPKHLGLIKAEEYFKKAAKYAVAELNAGEYVTNNFLADDINRDFLEQTPTSDNIKLQAAESYLFASRSCYIQGKLNEAADLASKGFNLVPQLVEAGFMQAKALSANKKETQAAIVLEKVINTDRFYSIKTLSDLDLCPKPSIQTLLKKLQKEATEEAIITLRFCRQHMISGSKATDYIEKIERLATKKTYLTSKKAIDLLNEVHNWKFCEPFENPEQTDCLNEIIAIVNTLPKLKYYKSEDSYLPVNDTFIDVFANKISQETQWIFPLHSIECINSTWTNNIKSKDASLSVVQYLVKEKELNDTLLKVVSHLKNLIQKYVDDNNSHLNYLEKERKEEEERLENERKEEEERLENERKEEDERLENERKEKERQKKAADDENRSDAIGDGIKYLFGGLGLGMIGGFILSGIIDIISSIFYEGLSNRGYIITIIVVMAIAGGLGFYIGYGSTRNK